MNVLRLTFIMIVMLFFQMFAFGDTVIPMSRMYYESANVRQEKTQEKAKKLPDIIPELIIIVICVGFLLIIQEILLFRVIKKRINEKKIRRIAIGIWITFFAVIMVALSMRLLSGECAVKNSCGEPMYGAPMPLTRPKPAFQEKTPQCKCGYWNCSCGPFVSVSDSGRCNCEPSQRFSSR